MRRKAPSTNRRTWLRQRAQARLRNRGPTPRSSRVAPRVAASAVRLLHELQIHQVELEMQNAELQDTRNETDALLAKYSSLFNFAPVGYFCLDSRGRIIEANLTGSTMLGIERTRLLGRNMRDFLTPASRTILRRFIRQLGKGIGERACQATLLRENGEPFWTNIHGAKETLPGKPNAGCRLAISDITSLKQAEEALRNVESLTHANLALRQEILRRQAVEKTLKKSQQHQSQLLRMSHRMQEQRQFFSHQILKAQEEERKRISRELHDSITQTLVGIHVQLEGLVQDAEKPPEDLRQRIARTQQLVQQSVNIVHAFARELRPALLDDLGLTTTLQALVKDFARRTGIEVQFATCSTVDRLNSDCRTVLYRVAQSALNNVAQHAHASRVRFAIRRLKNGIRMQIADDGRAFDAARLLRSKANKRLGLIGMRERIEMVGGSFSLESVPGRGTTISADIPFAQKPTRKAPVTSS